MSSHQVLRPDVVLTDDGPVTDVDVILQGARIEALQPRDGTAADGIHELAGLTLAPGLIDLQVNGGGGVMFNDEPTVDGLRTITEAHRRLGTTTILPTLITAPDATLLAGARAVTSTLGSAVAGLHLEGPLISPRRSGVHPPQHVRTSLSEEVLDACPPGRTMLTVAPEVVGEQTLRELRRRGFRLAIGHSDATAEQSAAAVDAGCTLVTHLFNACSGFTARNPGVIGHALADERLHAGLIMDGHHVHPTSARAALRAFTPGTLFLVTDALAVVGSDHSTCHLEGLTVHAVDGVCRTEDGALAGGAVPLAAVVRQACQLLGVDGAEAIRMASTYPARYLGLHHELGRVAPGCVANLIALDAEHLVRHVWYEGALVPAAIEGA